MTNGEWEDPFKDIRTPDLTHDDRGVPQCLLCREDLPVCSCSKDTIKLVRGLYSEIAELKRALKNDARCSYHGCRFYKLGEPSKCWCCDERDRNEAQVERLAKDLAALQESYKVLTAEAYKTIDELAAERAKPRWIEGYVKPGTT